MTSSRLLVLVALQPRLRLRLVDLVGPNLALVRPLAQQVVTNYPRLLEAQPHQRWVVVADLERLVALVHLPLAEVPLAGR